MYVIYLFLFIWILFGTLICFPCFHIFALIVPTPLLWANINPKMLSYFITFSYFVIFILVPRGVLGRVYSWLCYNTFFCFLSFKVCQLRERRLDLEEELAEEKKTSDTLKKEYDALVKKAKVIDSALKTAEADLEAFQVTIHTRHLNKELWSKNDTTMIEYDI